MTARLYYDDPYLLTFDATVVDVRANKRQLQLALDRSAFYPTSGGQQHDTGLLVSAANPHGIRVTDVVDDAGIVWHVVEHPLDVGTAVAGAIDGARRADHRQQHTGQHVLSASCSSVCKAETRSVHLGTDSCTLDLDRHVSADELDAVEADANRIVFENRPVRVRYVDAAEAATLPLRRATARVGSIRLIEIDGHDLSACGGTHVTHTGEIGAIVLQGADRVRGGARLTFACGQRAVTSHRRLLRTLDAAARQLSQGPLDVPTALARLQDDSREARRALDVALARLGELEAQLLASTFERVASLDVLVRLTADVDPVGLRRLAVALTDVPGRVVAMLGGTPPYALVVARSADLDEVDASAVAREIVAATGGKAGGRADVAQGGGVVGSAADVRDVVLRVLGAVSDRV